MPQSVDRDDRDVTGFAMPAENVVHRRIIDSGVDKDGLIFGKVLYQFRTDDLFFVGWKPPFPL